MEKKVPYYVREIRKGQDAEEQENFQRRPRLMVAGVTNHGAVERISLGLLAIWREQEQAATAFSAGPSYQKLQALRLASGSPAYTLDSWFHDEGILSYLITRYSEGQRLALIQATEPYFDTYSPLMPAWSESSKKETPKGSMAELARMTKTPVIMVVDASHFSFTDLAYWKGLLDFRQGEVIAGFILAGLPQSQLAEVKRQLEAELELPVLGSLEPELYFDEIPILADMVPEVYEDIINKKTERLAQSLRKTIDLTRLLEIADLAPALDTDLPQSLFRAQRLLGSEDRRYRLGVALDEAFCYYYKENLDILREMGAEIVHFSPLRDPVLPPDLDGLYFGTGKLLDYLAEASHNETLQTHIRRFADRGVPILAEGTGALYLAKAYRTDNGREWPLVALLPTVASPNPESAYSYYASMTARRDDLLAEHGTHIPCLLSNTQRFEPDGASYRTSVRGVGYIMEGFSTPSIWASQARLHFYAQPLVAARFTKACLKNFEARTGNGESLQGWN